MALTWKGLLDFAAENLLNYRFINSAYIEKIQAFPGCEQAYVHLAQNAFIYCTDLYPLEL